MTLVPASSHPSGGGSGLPLTGGTLTGELVISPSAVPADGDLKIVAPVGTIAGGGVTLDVRSAETMFGEQSVFTVNLADGIAGFAVPAQTRLMVLDDASANDVFLVGSTGAVTVAPSSAVTGVTSKGFRDNTITSGALPTVTCASGTGRQVSTIRDVETHTPVTFNPGVATTATCKVELSPDNTTYTELATITKPVGTVFDGEIEDVVVRVTAGWYIRLTVNAQATIGTTTYY